MQVNGTELALNRPHNLLTFLLERGYRPERIAVEYNGRIVPKEDYASVELCDSDVIEVVAFMGGGQDSRNSPAKEEFSQ